MKQAILCGKLLNTVKKRVDTDQVILVEDDRIQAVERREAIEIPEGYEIVDCSDRFVTPGLIDAHLHTAFDPMTYLKDYTGDGVIRGLINAKKDLLAGFTTLRDMGCTFYADVSMQCHQQRQGLGPPHEGIGLGDQLHRRSWRPEPACPSAGRISLPLPHGELPR